MTDSAALTAAAPSARLTANMLSNSGAAAAAIAEQQEDQPLASEHTHCLNQGSASASVGHVPVTVAFKVTPINPSSGQALALPQLLTGDAAMALHALLIQLHVKKMVRCCAMCNSSSCVLQLKWGSNTLDHCGVCPKLFLC